MKTISVKAVKREEYGKKAAKAVRREGMVPCVLSGHGESVAFSVDPREIKPLIYTPNSYIVEFDIEGKKEQAVLRKAAALREQYNVTVLPQGKKLGKQLGQLEAAGFAGAAFMDKDEVKIFALQ